MGSLESLVLGYNHFIQVEGGSIIGFLTKNLCNLKVLDLGANLPGIQGDLLGPYENVSREFQYCSLERLDLSNNNFTGFLPYLLSGLRKLKSLNLKGNRFFGPLPSFIGNLSSLQELLVGDNHLSGFIPSSIGSLSFLQDLDLSWNSFQGEISNSHLSNLSSLEFLYLNDNSLKWGLSSNWTPPFQLEELDLTICVIGGEFPQWVRTQKWLHTLDLSNTGISGQLPQCFQSMILKFIVLSNNHITGQITYFASYPSLRDISHNLLSGSLPFDISSTNNCSVQTSPCQFLRYLYLMDLSYNNLSGTIPNCLIELSNLEVINLSFNKFSGHFPGSIRLSSMLRYLELSNNLLEGEIPLGLNNCTNLEILNLRQNNLSGEIPSWGNDSHINLRILRLRDNQLGGVIPEKLCSLSLLHILDLANNNLTGNIPHCFERFSGMSTSDDDDFLLTYGADRGYLSMQDAIEYMKGEALEYNTTLGMVRNLDLSCNGLVGKIPEELTVLNGLRGLNLSHNHLSGNIPEKIGKMMSLESLDLSNNNLSGTIPSSMSSLTSLSHLNLSYNQLHGEIPTGYQLQTLNDPSMYSHNPGLCGDPLPKCIRAQPDEKEKEGDEWERDNNREKVLFYIVIMLSLATGFWSVVGTFLLNKRGRDALFQLVDDIVDYLYVQIMVRIRKMRN